MAYSKPTIFDRVPHNNKHNKNKYVSPARAARGAECAAHPLRAAAERFPPKHIR